MEPTIQLWQSQRNKRRWAIVLIFLILILIALSSCSVQPRYHNRGWNIELGGGQFSRKGTSTPTTVKTTSVVSKVAEIDSNELMHIPAKLIRAGRKNKWVYPDTVSTVVAKKLCTFTIYTDSSCMHGKLVGANENGVFLYNMHDPLFWVAKKPYGITQTAIKRKILFMPYSEIKSIRKGGTVASRLERILNGLFWLWFGAGAIAGGGFTLVYTNFWLSANTIEDIIAGLMLIAAVIAAILCALFSLILTPLIFLLELPFKKLKGRFWRIDYSEPNGQRFLNQIKKKHGRYRLYKDDLQF
jgi:hypothetical protein